MNDEALNSAEPMNGRKAIWVFTPSRTDPKDLEFILVQRQELLKDAVERVRESVLTDNKHHLLFVGPRGCGKTHLATLIVSRLAADNDLANSLRIAWLNEDETCTSLLELLVKVHGALTRRYPDEFREDTLAAAYDLKPEAALEFVSKHLLSALGPRTLLMVVENLDAIFDGLGEEGQKELRAFIQEHPKLSIVATAQRLVDDLSDRKSPFFGFFQTEHLKPLNVSEATELLQKIARLQGNTGVVEFLSTSRGRSRVRALHHLSGGNHRIYIVLSHFITRDSMESLQAPFMKMVDELTPYYQERIRWLPPLQRKIVEYLCSCQTTVPVKDIVKKLFSTAQSISSQLQDLREKGYVEANQRGRESLYEISEPLMRICVEVKENQLRQPFRLLVDFLRVWYDDQQLKDRLGKMEPTLDSCAYLKCAIDKNSAEGNLRKQIILEDLESFLSEKMEPTKRVVLLRELANKPEAIALSMTNWHQGNKTEAQECLDEAIAGESDSSSKADILMSRAALYIASHEPQKAILDYTTVVGLSGMPADVTAQALINRGFMYGQIGQTQREIEDYTALTKLSGASIEIIATAFYFRGITYGEKCETQREIEDYTAVVGLPSAPVDLVAKALLNRGITYGREGDIQHAIEDYTSIVGLPSPPVESAAKALLYRGVTYAQSGETGREIEDYTAVIELSGAPAKSVAEARLYRGMAYGRLGDTQREIEDYTAVVEIAGAPADVVARALVHRGVVHRQLGEGESEIADYTLAIGLSGAPVEMVAKALVNRIIARFEVGEVQKAIEDCSVVIGLSGVPVEQVAKALYIRGTVFFRESRKHEAQSDFEVLTNLTEAPVNMVIAGYLNLAGLHFSEGRWSDGLQRLETGLAHGAKLQPPCFGKATDLIGTIFSAGLNPEGRRDKVNDILRIYNEHHALSVLGEGVVQHIGNVFRAGEPFPSADNLEGWAVVWEQAAERVPDLALSVRLLRTGVNFVKSGGKDRGVLLDLTSGERTILEQAFGLAGKEHIPSLPTG